MYKKYNEIEHAKSVVDVYLNQRFNLIPNLVDCVKAYTNYEEKSLNELVTLRNGYLENKDFETAVKVESKISNVMLDIENYPKLKANEQFIILEENLIKMESQIQAARRVYNNEVENYNYHISVFPNNLIAKLFQFEAVEFFKMEETDG